MLIGKEVDIPEALIEAQKNGSLVIFAGAGISMGAPSNLPSFDLLADKVGKATAARRPGEQLDEYLGRVESIGARIQDLTRKVLSEPNSMPRQLHHDLLGLFSDSRSVRVVTTNFDLHLTTACRARFGDDVEIYTAPALPTGRDFAGLAYLHGSLAKRAPLVLTDRDFGRAYLTEGWATRLLLDVFQHFTVLFVGYSHEDPVMKYLARSLFGQPRRFVLTRPDQDEKWAMLGIRPLHFPLRTVGDAYGALDDVLAAWVKRSRMGALDHQVRIREIVLGPTALDEEDQDYLRAALSDEVMLRFFVESAGSIEWLQWVSGTGVLTPLFVRDGVADARSSTLARWFAEVYSVAHAGVALRMVADNGGVLSPSLWQAVALHLGSCNPAPSPEVLAKWVVILIASARDHYDDHYWNQLLARCRDDGHLATARVLIRILSRPLPVVERPWVTLSDTSGAPHIRLSFRGRADVYELRETWQAFFVPRLPQLSEFLCHVLADAIIEAHAFAMVETAGGFDALSFSRSAIESHTQDASDGFIDFAIDALRSVLDALVVASDPKVQRWIDEWLASDVPLLRRLAVYGLSELPTLAPNAAMRKVIEGGLLYAPHLKHEVYRLLEKKFPSASESAQREMIRHANKASVLDGDDEDAERRDISDYERFNAAAWLTKIAPESIPAAKNFTALEKRHPDFNVREVLDFDHWSSGARLVVQESPISPDDLLASPPDSNIDLLLSFDPKPGNRHGPSRSGLLNAAREAATRSVDWSLNLARLLASKNEWSNSLWDSVLRGWQNADMDARLFDDVVRDLSSWPQLSQTFGRCLADVVESWTGKRESLTADQLAMLEQIAAGSLQLDDGEDGVLFSDGRREWLTVAINHSGGRSALALVKLLSIRAKRGEAGAGLPARYRESFESIVASDSVSGSRARIVLVSQLHFLFSVDPSWTRLNMVPLFDWSSNELIAEQAWYGFVGWGRWNDALLAELLSFMPTTFSRLATSLSEIRDVFAQRLVGVALYLATDPWHGGWLADFVRLAGEEAREKWAWHLDAELRRIKPDAARVAWDSWIRDYWNDRLSGVPRPLSPGEGAEMVEWTLGLKPVFEEAVEKVCAQSSGLPERNLFFGRLKSDDVLATHPQTVAKLLTHVLPLTALPLYHCGPVEQIVRQLRKNGVAAASLSRVVESMVRAGCGGGASLLGAID